MGEPTMLGLMMEELRAATARELLELQSNEIEELRRENEYLKVELQSAHSAILSYESQDQLNTGEQHDD